MKKKNFHQISKQDKEGETLSDQIPNHNQVLYEVNVYDLILNLGSIFSQTHLVVEGRRTDINVKSLVNRSFMLITF